MPPLVISRDNITIGGKIIETAQSIGLSKQVAVNPLANTLIEEPVFNDTSLIAHYKFDGNYNDSSGNNHHLTNNGSSLQSTHVINGQAVEFDNTDYLEFPSTINPYTIWNGGNGITFAFWVKVINSGSWSRFIDFQTGNNLDTGILIAKEGSGNKLAIVFNNTTRLSINMTWNSNVWQHLSFSVSSSGIWSLYLDGINQNINVTFNIPNIAYNLRYINKSVYAANGNWDGQMDDFSIYNRVLTHVEITSLYFSKNTLVPITINDDYKYMTFINNTADLLYDFTGLANAAWLSLVDSIPNSSRTAGNWYAGGSTYPGLFISPGEAFISIILPSGYTHIDITYGNQDPIVVAGNRVDLSINGTVVSTAIGGVYKTHSQSYVAGDVLRIEEFVAQIHRNLIIRIYNTQKTYNINFPEQTEIQLLLLDNLKYIETAPFLTSGSNNIVVGVPSTFNTITTTTNSKIYNNGYVSTITGTSVAYNSPIVIIRYKITKNIVPININEDYKYFSLTYNDIPEVVYDFTPYNTLQSWISYANSFGATTNVTAFDQGGVLISNNPIGHITYPLPNNYNYIDVIFGNPVSNGNVNLYIDNVLKMSTTGIQTRTYSDTYTTGQILKIDETNTAIIGKNLIIKLARRQSQYSITFQENTECDILIVAGGGGGGRRHGAGGGAGTLLYHKGQMLNGTYNINVGKGGNGNTSAVNTTNASSGNFSEFKKTDNTKRYYANGGGVGTSGGVQEAITNGGQGYLFNSALTLPTNNVFNDVTVSVVSKQYQNTLSSPEGCRGFVGGGQVENFKGGGGGGAGSLGQSHGLESTINDGYGGDGLGVDITGINVLYAGGGNGGDFNGTVSPVRDPNKLTIESRGGGGFGSDNNVAEAGMNGTGGGGGGQGNDLHNGGNGGSGIVIIRYKKIAAPYDAQWTYNSINSSVYHLGNVGIGTINPTSVLDVLGSVVVNGGIISTSLEANAKNFKIAHPLNINKWLYHGCVEGPRFDNMYRGKKMVINGTCEVDIDIECNTTGGMTTGTFMALNNNCQVFLENKQTYDMVKGEVIDGKIIISCENIAEEIEVEWLVIGERHDEGIIRNKLTNSEGMLICEHEY